MNGKKEWINPELCDLSVSHNTLGGDGIRYDGSLSEFS